MNYFICDACGNTDYNEDIIQECCNDGVTEICGKCSDNIIDCECDYKE